MSDFAEYLAPNFFVDADHAEVIRYAREHAAAGSAPTEAVVDLYYAIRDGFRYNPWGVKLEPAGFKASAMLLRDRADGGHCIDKANLLAACARVIGVPSRLHFANVRNHIGTEQLERLLGTSLLVFHGYAELYLDERWVAATPAFNKELCDHLNVAPLEFDGTCDSIFQQYDRAGGRFMEYVHDFGPHADIPFGLMVGEWKKHYGIDPDRDAWPLRPA